MNNSEESTTASHKNGSPSHGVLSHLGVIRENGSLDLSRPWHVLVQQKWTAILVCVFCALMGALYVQIATPIYSATNTVEMHSRRPRIFSGQDAVMSEDNRSAPIITDALNTQFQKMQTMTVHETVATELRKLSREYPQLREIPPEMYRLYVSNTVRLRRVRGTHLVYISMESDSPEFAAVLANTYAQACVDVIKNSTKTASLDAIIWLEEQKAVYEKELLKNEAQLIAFQQKHDLTGVRSALRAATDSIITINQSLVEYETQRSVLEDLVATLQNIVASPDAVGFLPSTTPRSTEIQMRLREYLDVNDQLKEASTKYTKEHPIVQELSRQMVSRQQELEFEVVRAKKTADSDLALVNAYVKSIGSDKADMIASANELQDKISRYSTEVIPLQRAVAASTSSYKGLLDRIEQARLASDEDTSLLTIYERASPPQESIKPRKKIILAASLLLGGVFGILMAFVKHFLDDRISDLYDLEVGLGLPVIGTMPHMKGMKTASNASSALDVFQVAKFGDFAESMAKLRAFLMTPARARVKGWTVLVSSPEPSAGKSTTACALAMALAKTNKRVFIIDGDMRRPRLHELFGVKESGTCLMDILVQEDAGPKDYASVPVKTEVPNLDVALGHPVEGVNPMEVLENGRFQLFLAWAKTEYDVIVIDSPPIGILGDAITYGRLADDIILINRFDKTRKSLMRDSVRILERNALSLTGVVLNDFSPNSRRGAAGHYGYYHSGYGNYGDS